MSALVTHDAHAYHQWGQGEDGMSSGEKQPARPLTISVDGLPPSPNRHMAWQKRRRLVKPLADAVVEQGKALGLAEPLERARVQFTLIHTRGPLRDADNAQSSCKELLDALVRGGVLADDGPGHVDLAGIVQVFGAHAGVCIEVWPLHGAGAS